MSAQDLLSQFEAIIAVKKQSEKVKDHQAKSGEAHYSKQIGSRLSPGNEGSQVEPDSVG